MKEFGLNDLELFPLLNEASDAMLRRLRQHPHAPRYNWQTGERLTQAGLANIHHYASRVDQGPQPWPSGQLPPWVMPFIERCRRQVPFYRDRLNRPDSENFRLIPLTPRNEIRKQPWSFVADDLPLDNLIVYTTSGTTGSMLRIPATAELPNRYLPLIRRALSKCSIDLEGGSRVSIIHVCCQQPTVVLCSISSYLGGAGFAKVNLHPADWNHPDDATAFLDDCNPELYTGDPFALQQLGRLQLQHKPKAIVSSGTALSAGLRRSLSDRFSCPVIDMYSMNEAGPIGFSTTDGVYQVLQPDLYIEVLNEAGQPCPPGIVGEIVLTGGINPYLPLIRYPTGDFASLQENQNSLPNVINLQGRGHVLFKDTHGRWFNSIDVSSALQPLPLASFSLHQNKDGSLKFSARGEADIDLILNCLTKVFGPSQQVDVVPTQESIRIQKSIVFSSDMEQPISWIS